MFTIDNFVFAVYNMRTMFKIKKITKYTFFALAIAFVVFVAVPTSSVKANGEDDSSYYGTGYEDTSSYSTPDYSYGTGYENSYTTPTHTEPNYVYTDTTPVYSQPYTYADTSYSSPAYSYGGGGCSSCSSYNNSYNYTPAPQIVYVPNQSQSQYQYQSQSQSQNQTQTQTQSLDASCVINPNNVNVNDTVVASGSASGGTGSYSYLWSGPDGISGSGQTVSGRFTSTGLKTVYLTVTSGSQSVSRSCNAYVNQVVVPPPQTLDASCTISPNNININDTVTISGNATGGSGSYSYIWSGSDGISGSSQVITGRFTSYGSKVVSLTVTSGSQTITRSCNAYVNQNYNYNYNQNYNYGYNYNYNNGYNYNYAPLSATCSASPVNANVGDNVVWTVYPVGGNGTYTYTWSGTDGLSYGNAYQIQQRYTTPGTKTATVTVYSTNGGSITATCSTNIAGSIVTGRPISGIYLNEVPATGIDFNVKIALYILGLILWSAFVGFMVVEKKKAKLALANKARIEDFKQENLRRKGML